MTNNISALYVHIPFCKSICSYCDFAKVIYKKDLADEYIKTILAEINSYKIIKFKTIYIGGGTPSSLSLEQLEYLLANIFLLLDNNYELTIEANIEDINAEFLETIKKYGVNRLSIGIQTFNEELKLLLKRKHNNEEIKDKIALARSYGFGNISIDMMYALPTQTLDDLKEDLKKLVSLNIEHISYYSLLIEENTFLYTKGFKMPDDIVNREMYDLIVETLEIFDYYRYEVSNFSKLTFQSRHNNIYWHNEHYIGVGAHASSYIGNIRYTNIRKIGEYIKNDDKIATKIVLKIEDIMFEEIMLRLRLTEGLSILEFNSKFNTDFYTIYDEAIFSSIADGLLMIKDDTLIATSEGIALLNLVLERFMK